MQQQYWCNLTKVRQQNIQIFGYKNVSITSLVEKVENGYMEGYVWVDLL